MSKISFILIRHGTTRMNDHTDASADRIRGWADVPLSKEGRDEAQKLVKELHDTQLDIIYTSDLKRAEDTAKVIAEDHNIEMQPMEQLRPWDLGEFTGESTKEVMPEIEKYVCDTPEKKVPEGESFAEFCGRFFSGLDIILKQSRDEKFAIVTHHRVERLLKAWIAEGCPDDHTIDIKVFLQKGEPPATAETITVSV